MPLHFQRHDISTLSPSLDTNPPSLFSSYSYKDTKTIEDFTLIDFGLASIDALAEEKAVDLYVFERALKRLLIVC